MSRGRNRGGPATSPLDGLFDWAHSYVRQTADDITRGLGRALAGELGMNQLKEATPMRIKRPKTWTQMCNWLAGLGLGNHYYPEDGPVVIAQVKAITVHAVTRDGREVNLLTVMSPQWENPWQNEDGTGPRRR